MIIDHAEIGGLHLADRGGYRERPLKSIVLADLDLGIACALTILAITRDQRARDKESDSQDCHSRGIRAQAPAHRCNLIARAQLADPLAVHDMRSSSPAEERTPHVSGEKAVRPDWIRTDKRSPRSPARSALGNLPDVRQVRATPILSCGPEQGTAIVSRR
jgi:hypothetical protein